MRLVTRRILQEQLLQLRVVQEVPRHHGEDEPAEMADVIALLERVQQVPHHPVLAQGLLPTPSRALTLCVRHG
ncbi:hypothetical protein ACN28S_40795 [Cystobacter fuscus]